ncbi:UNVERIFIED_CONTAM: hypothetical protein Sangu_0554000 [Sesamum angustifolium]|uniref:CRAL-TRIO domain-containing protein n=1 Tax=Sesamum angustifolium TaxID=2727405 RepID=A0AAW2Q9T6_9LAMI
MAQCLRLRPPLLHHFKTFAVRSKKPTKIFKLGVRSCYLAPENAHKLVAEVKEKLEKEHNGLPVGKYGRDDEEMILWFLKDRKFSIEDTVAKLTKAIRWRHEFRVSELSEESVKIAAETGKAYVHNYPDVYGRPVLIVEAAKHFPGIKNETEPLNKSTENYQNYAPSITEECLLLVAEWGAAAVTFASDLSLLVDDMRQCSSIQKQEPREDEKLCVFMIEKALSKLPAGKQEILEMPPNISESVVAKSSDHLFYLPIFDAFYYYYPRRLGQVLFVDAPFVFKPVWQLVKPLLKSYASLVRFCSAKTVREEYFTADILPPIFRN